MSLSFAIYVLILGSGVLFFSYLISAFSDRKLRNVMGMALFLLLLILILPGEEGRRGISRTMHDYEKPFYNCYMLAGCQREKFEQPFEIDYKNDQINWIVALLPAFLLGISLGFKVGKKQRLGNRITKTI